MAYGMNQLRKAGTMLREFDDSYAKKVQEMYIPSDVAELREKHPVDVSIRAGLQAVLGGQAARDMKLGLKPGFEDNIFAQGAERALSLGVPAISTAVRYGAPVAGVTLAGKGIIDLTGMLIQDNEQTGGTLMP